MSESGLRADAITKVVGEPESIFHDYESFKNTYKSTKSKCEQAGHAFTPMVFEAHGGSWSAAARSVLDSIAKQQLASGGACKDGHSLRVAQRLSTAIHMATSRAILKRLWQADVEADVFDLEAADATTEDEL